MKYALVAATFLVYVSFVAGTSKNIEYSTDFSFQRQDNDYGGARTRPCPDVCYIGPNALTDAYIACLRSNVPCYIENCTGPETRGDSSRIRDGYKCMPMVSVETEVPATFTTTPTPSSSPNTATISGEPSVTAAPTPSSSPTIATISGEPSVTAAPTPSSSPATSNVAGEPIITPEMNAVETDEPNFSASPSPSQMIGPTSEGPVEVPEFISFPNEVSIGGSIDVEVTVVLDEVSSSLKEDIYLLADATASMKEEIETIQKRFGNLVAARRNASSDVSFGVGFYRDEQDSASFMNVQPITNNIDAVTTAINSLVAEGDTDDAEANLYALSQVATLDSIGWRDGSRKILVYMGDAPGHEPTCPNGGTPITRDVVIDQLNEKGITVVATNFAASKRKGLNDVTYSSENSEYACATATKARSGQASQITSETLGALEQASNPKTLVDVIRDTIGKLDQELDVTTMDCGNLVDISFTPELPISIASGETKIIFEHAKLMPAACAHPEGFKCEIKINLSGVGIRQTIQTTSISGC